MLEASGDPAAQRVAAGLRASVQDSLHEDERSFVERIEDLRHELEESEEALPRGSSAELLSNVTRTGSVSRYWGLVLFLLIRELKPQSCLELGTCVGISAVYQGAALELNGSGGLVSLEGAAERAAVAERNLMRLGIASASVRVGLFQDTLEPALRELAPVDYAFVDGQHDRDATIEYFKQLLPHAAEHAVLVFDDIDWSHGMRDAWERIGGDPRLTATAGMGRLGLCVVGSMN
jgi:predicted O-methyltransferase YrrM